MGQQKELMIGTDHGGTSKSCISYVLTASTSRQN